jgi:hypothetical protein
MQKNPAILVGAPLLNNTVSLPSDVGGNVDNIRSVGNNSTDARAHDRFVI